MISKLKQRVFIISKINWASKYVFKGLHFVMYLAPIGAFGGMAYTIGKYGVSTLLPLMKLMACVYITMALFVIFILGAVLKYCKVNIFSFLNYIKKKIDLSIHVDSDIFFKIKNYFIMINSSKNIITLIRFIIKKFII